MRENLLGSRGCFQSGKSMYESSEILVGNQVG